MRPSIFLKLLFVSVYCLPAMVTAQDADLEPDLQVLFSSHFGGSGNEQFFGGARCSNGDYLLAGLSLSTDHDLAGTTMDTANIFIVRCNDSGQLVWSKVIGGNDYDKARFVMEDNDLNILVVGGSQSVDGDITANIGNSDLVIAKLDPAGNKIWLKNYGGTDFEGGRFISQSSDGNYIVCGYTRSQDHHITDGGRGFHDGWMMKIDTDGNVLWSRTYGGEMPDRIRSCVELPDGGFLFAGQSESTTQDCTGNHGTTDLWAGRVDKYGNLVWSKLYGGSKADRAYHISSCSNGTFFITGHTRSDDQDVSGHKGEADGWIIEIDTDGNVIWKSTIGGSRNDLLFRTYQSDNGSIISAGSSASDDHDCLGLNCQYGDSFFIMKHDYQRNLEWMLCTGGELSDVCNELILEENDSFTLMGDSRSSDGTVPGNYGEYDYWIVRLQWPADPPSETPSYQDALSFDFAGQALIISSSASRTVSLKIFSIDGKLVTSQNGLSLPEGILEVPFEEISGMSRGNYLVIMESDTDRKATTITVTE